MRETEASEHVQSAAHARSMLTTQGRVLRLIATGKPFETVLQAFIDAVETHCAGAMGSVLLMDDDGEHLRHGRAPRLPDEYNRIVDGLRIGPRAGSCGTAAYRGEPVIVEDISTSSLWVDYLDVAARFRLGACWSHPILSTGRQVLGTLAIYFGEPRKPVAQDRELLAAVAHLAGIAVERHHAERRRRAAERRLLHQKTVLVELAKSEPLASGDFGAFCKRATEVAAATLGVERVSVWLFNKERTVLRCRDLYEIAHDRHSPGIDLDSGNYPRYFAALERGRSVVAHDARRDPDTSEFTDTYLEPLGISSMLDAPVRRSGRLVGVVCHEHVGPRRTWAADEQDFAASIGDFVSLALEAGERLRAERAFRSTQEELLRQNFQARRQIEFELVRMKDELIRQARRGMIVQVSAGMAHELRKPLARMREASRMLREHPAAGDPEWADSLAEIEQEIERSELTVSGLLQMSEARQPVKEAIELSRVVHEAMGFVRAAEGIELRLELDPDPFPIEADPRQLRQLMTHLMSNAAEALGRRGRITVEARRGDDFDEIVVRDDGPGIAADLRDRIFEPLVTTKARGSGLGLPVCRQLVERHGGSIEAVDREGRGATILVRLSRSGGAARSVKKVG